MYVHMNVPYTWFGQVEEKKGRRVNSWEGKGSVYRLVGENKPPISHVYRF